MPNDNPQVGEVYIWGGAVVANVTKVGRKYATLLCREVNGASWEKKQPLPISGSFVLQEGAA